MKNLVPDTCPECGGEMRYVCTTDPGDEEGRNSRALYQCEKCKRIEERS